RPRAAAARWTGARGLSRPPAWRVRGRVTRASCGCATRDATNEQRFRRTHDLIRGESELPHQHVARRRGSETVERDGGAGGAHPALPAEGSPRLDGEPRGDRGGEEGLPVPRPL